MRQPFLPAAAVVLALVLPACGAHHNKPSTPQPPGSAAGPTPAATPLPVKRAEGEVIVAAWSEPKHLPSGGGEAQILVRLQKRGGAPFPDVEVRLQTTAGSLYSGGRILITDAAGRTRDRLTTRKGATLTVNAGGTIYRFQIPVGG